MAGGKQPLVPTASLPGTPAEATPATTTKQKNRGFGISAEPQSLQSLKVQYVKAGLTLKYDLAYYCCLYCLHKKMQVSLFYFLLLSYYSLPPN